MKDKENKSAKDLAWELFEETGNFSYYMLYKQLKD
ncbi:MAG: YqzL family protein [Clostridia bacterium]|nr:YqzL family protein [Clostridia bacterium]